MTEELGQALVDELRRYGMARYIAPFTHDEAGVALGTVEVYRAVPHQDGRDVAGNPLEGVYFEQDETPQVEAAVNTAAVSLLAARFDGKRAQGTLMVDESGRIWAHELQETDIAGIGDGTKARLEL